MKRAVSIHHVSSHCLEGWLILLIVFLLVPAVSGVPRPAQASGPDLPLQAISAGGSHTCGLRSDGSLVCWGQNAYGETDVPVLPAVLDYTQVSAGAGHTCGLRAPYCVGEKTSRVKLQCPGHLAGTQKPPSSSAACGPVPIQRTAAASSLSTPSAGSWWG